MPTDAPIKDTNIHSSSTFHLRKRNSLPAPATELVFKPACAPVIIKPFHYFRTMKVLALLTLFASATFALPHSTRELPSVGSDHVLCGEVRAMQLDCYTDIDQLLDTCSASAQRFNTAAAQDSSNRESLNERAQKWWALFGRLTEFKNRQNS